jgi:hypothetical protein
MSTPAASLLSSQRWVLQGGELGGLAVEERGGRSVGEHSCLVADEARIADVIAPSLGRRGVWRTASSRCRRVELDGTEWTAVFM